MVANTARNVNYRTKLRVSTCFEMLCVYTYLVVVDSSLVLNQCKQTILNMKIQGDKKAYVTDDGTVGRHSRFGFSGRFLHTTSSRNHEKR